MTSTKSDTNLSFVKTLTGREASLLALLAQSKGSDISVEERDRVLSQLQGDARRIGEVLVGVAKRPRKDARVAAEGFQSWVSSMRQAAS